MTTTPLKFSEGKLDSKLFIQKREQKAQVKTQQRTNETLVSRAKKTENI